jgi:hypothetical protein
MAWDHAMKIQTSHNIYLFMASFNSKYVSYIVETEAINCRGNTSCKEQEEEQEAGHS